MFFKYFQHTSLLQKFLSSLFHIHMCEETIYGKIPILNNNNLIIVHRHFFQKDKKNKFLPMVTYNDIGTM